MDVQNYSRVFQDIIKLLNEKNCENVSTYAADLHVHLFRISDFESFSRAPSCEFRPDFITVDSKFDVEYDKKKFLVFDEILLFLGIWIFTCQ